MVTTIVPTYVFIINRETVKKPIWNQNHNPNQVRLDRKAPY